MYKIWKKFNRYTTLEITDTLPTNVKCIVLYENIYYICDNGNLTEVQTSLMLGVPLAVYSL